MDQAHTDRLNELRAAKEAGTMDPTAEKELADLMELEGNTGEATMQEETQAEAEEPAEVPTASVSDSVGEEGEAQATEEAPATDEAESEDDVEEA